MPLCRQVQNQAHKYAETDAQWQVMHPRETCGVKVSAANVLAYETAAYHSTLLANYTRISLARHVYGTLRYVYPDLDTALRRSLVNKYQETAAMDTLKTALPEECLEMVKTVRRIQESRALGVSDAFMTEALQVRWQCMGMLDEQPPSKTITTSKGKEIAIMRQLFTLVPQCLTTPRFITLDNQYFRSALDLHLDAID